MTEKEIMDKTSASMEGRWIGENDKLKINLQISTNEISLGITNKENEETSHENYSSSAFWEYPFLILDGTNQRYFIKYANETEMVFGKNETAGNFNGKYEWLIKFNRITKPGLNG